MSDTALIKVGEKGRFVIPAEIRESFGWDVGTELTVLKTHTGIELLPRKALAERMRGMLHSGANVVDELLAERRAEAKRENLS